MRTILRDNYTPEMGAYHETLIIDEARHKKYLFDCDGVFTDITNPLVVSERGDSEDFAASQKWVTDIDDKVDGLAEDLGDEIQNRTDADDAIWAEIEEIEMSSDVVDIVGTYAELQQYDTTHLKDKDIIKVLSDETHNGEIAYYRWSISTSTFSYVGSEGPYYTESQIDTMMAGKQDVLTAGDYISISSQNVISENDTAVLYVDLAWQVSPGTYNIYKEHSLTNAITHAEFNQIMMNKNKVLLYNTDTEQKYYTTTVYIGGVDADWYVTDNKINYVVRTGNNDGEFTISQDWVAQPALNAGSNIQIDINTNTISATDTTYTHFTGATALADGVQGLVPGPLAGDQDKYLKADGTWATITVPTYSDFTGATASTAGAHGLVPAPSVGDQDKVLKGDGTWGDASTTLILYTSGIRSVSSGGTATRKLYYDKAMTAGNNISFADFMSELESGTRIVIEDVWTNYMPDEEMWFEIVEWSIRKDVTVAGVVMDAPFFVLKYIYPDEGATSMSSRTYRFSPSNSLYPSLSGDGIWFETEETIPKIVSATSSTAGIGKLYTTTGQNTDGAVTQKLFTDTVGDIESALQILNSGAGVP